MSAAASILFTLAIAASVATPPPVPPAQPSGEFVYCRLTNETWQVWRRDLTSGRDTQLTFSSGDKRYPGFTPDGDVYYHTVTQECFVLRENQSDRPLLSDLWPVRDVTFAPHDRQVAFSRIRTDLIDAANLCTSTLDGADPLWLTREPGIQYNPSYAPDGSWLAYVSGHGVGTYEIWAIDADGSNRRRITSNDRHEFLPAVSPDGQSIAFASDRSGDFEIWKVDASGANPQRLTDRPGLDTRPCWSPDGRWLAFTSARDGRVAIWYARSDGSDPRPLVATPMGARDPAWRAHVEPPAYPSAQTSNETGGAPEASRTAFALAEVGVSKKTIGPDATGSTIRFRVPSPARVRVDVVDEDGGVRRRLGGERVGAGPSAVDWDGRDEQERPVEDGVYRYVIVAEDDSGTQDVHDPSRGPWGERLEPTAFTIDRRTGELAWSMPKAGYARLRVAVTDFPLLRTLLDWEAFEAGPTSIAWDGLDESGEVKLLEHDRLWVMLELYALPPNTVLVKRGSPTGSDPACAAEVRADLVYPPLAAGPSGALEVRKPLRERTAPRLRVDLPESSAAGPDGRPIVSGLVPVRVTLDEADSSAMVDAMFEVAFYVDLTFIQEDEESTTPLTWIWDTRSLTPGPHLLTVNVFSYDGRIGCATRSVVVGGSE